MKHRLLAQITALLLVMFSPAIAYAQQGRAVEKASALIQEFMAETGAPGMAVSVGVKGHIVWSEGFGFADVEQRVPVWPSITRFRVGSVAKPMTAMAVAQVYEQGRLDLDAPVQQYVPSFPDKEGTVTVRLLAGHLAGIRHYQGDEYFSQKCYLTVLEGLTIFQDDPLLHSPGTKFYYSSYGWNLISAVVEAVSGLDFLTYMEEHVFKPIGMTHTIADHVDNIILNRTGYYVRQDGLLLNAPPVDNSYKWAGGGFLSTSEDLVRFGFAHMSPGLLKSETIELLWTSQQTTSGEKTGYGIGWRTGTDDWGRHWVGHGGGSVGGRTFFRMYPDTQVVVAIIANLSDVGYGDVPEKIARLFIEQ
ncbi:beta-lactamase family protein [Acidobacteria bacterium AH-259-A15]|nr:beta-lactamase family protein [Acidobacteria bacterium AH-259-A15]